jgi:peptidylprolyl isomerase
MDGAKSGDRVKVRYTVRNEGEDRPPETEEIEPLDFTLGQGEVKSELERAVLGMQVGESKVVKIISEEDYGPYRQDQVFEVDKNIFPQGQQPEPGREVLLHLQGGEEMTARILEVSGDRIIIDTNHPLAGREVNLDIMLAEIN